MSKNVNHEIFVCDCASAAHQFVISTWNFGDGSPTLDVSVKLNVYNPWYKRIVIAFKYLFKLNVRYEFDTVILNNEDINRLQVSLEKFKELQKKALVEDYKF